MIPFKTPLIGVKGLSHTYLAGTDLSVDSLKNIDLEVFRGETVGIIGPAGSGKSTLLQHLNGLLRPQRGDVWVKDISILHSGEEIRTVRTHVGLLFQNPENQLFEQFAGADVAFGPRNMGLSTEEVRRRVKNAMEMVGLPFSYKDRLTAHLSLGEKRRLALAGVLAMDPEVLVLDEPTASLDPDGRRRLLHILSGWKSSGIKAMVIASHNMEDIVETSDRVYVLLRGKIALAGTTRQVFSGVDFLLQNDLAVPVASELMHYLRKRGFPVSSEVLTDREAAQEVRGLYDA